MVRATPAVTATVRRAMTMIMPLLMMSVTTGVTMAMRPVPMSTFVMAAASPLVATFVTVLIPSLRGHGCHYGEATDKAEQGSKNSHIDC